MVTKLHMKVLSKLGQGQYLISRPSKAMPNRYEYFIAHGDSDVVCVPRPVITSLFGRGYIQLVARKRGAPKGVGEFKYVISPQGKARCAMEKV